MAGVMRKTNRGFRLKHFMDSNGVDCSIQESSAIGGFLWLGVHDVQHKYFPGDCTGWHDVALPDGVSCFSRMHLNRKQVRALLPLLERFAKNGSLEP
jgi:hypothetical protein